MPYKDTRYRNLKSKDKPYKLFDGDGLFLLVNPNGKKFWRYKYRLDGKERLLSLGVYPVISLERAREKHLAARKLLAEGIDPSAAKQAEKAARGITGKNSFQVVGLEWFNKQKPTWSKSHASRVLGRLENDLFPYLGSTPVAKITPPALRATLQRIEERGAIETAHRVKQIAGQILRYAVVTDRVERDSSQELKGALAPPVKKHFPAITEPLEVGRLLITTDEYEGTPTVQSALKLAPLVFVRPGELRL